MGGPSPSPRLLPFGSDSDQARGIVSGDRAGASGITTDIQLQVATAVTGTDSDAPTPSLPMPVPTRVPPSTTTGNHSREPVSLTAFAALAASVPSLSMEGAVSGGELDGSLSPLAVRSRPGPGPGDQPGFAGGSTSIFLSESESVAVSAAPFPLLLSGSASPSVAAALVSHAGPIHGTFSECLPLDATGNAIGADSAADR